MKQNVIFLIDYDLFLQKCTSRRKYSVYADILFEYKQRFYKAYTTQTKWCMRRNVFVQRRFKCKSRTQNFHDLMIAMHVR